MNCSINVLQSWTDVALSVIIFRWLATFESCKYRVEYQIEYRLSASLDDINIEYRKMAKTHIGTALKAAKAIIAFYNRSMKGTERLTELQEQLSLPKHKLLSDCPTRWNSTYYMLTRLLEQKPAITVMCASSDGPSVSLSSPEWCMMSKLIQILKPLEEAARELSTEQRVSCSKVIPLLNALLFELRKNVVDDDETQVPESQGSSGRHSSEESQQVISDLIASIEQRCLNYDEDRIFSVCTLLDPRFKEVCFTSTALVRVKRLLFSIMHTITQGDSATSSTSVVSDDVPVKKKKLFVGKF